MVVGSIYRMDLVPETARLRALEMASSVSVTLTREKADGSDLDI